MKKIMFITHQLSRTGAPIVMLDAVKVFLEAGHMVSMISMNDGELREEVEALGIEITIRSEFMDDWRSFLTAVWDYDLVFVNTIVPLQTIHLLNLAHMPVIWWLHEPEVYFDVYDQWLPKFAELKAHVHVWAVSPVVRDILKKRYDYEVPVVPFGVRDASLEKTVQDDSLVTFLTVGVFCKRKGQDLAMAAISRLPEKIAANCRFLFCGNQTDVEPEVFEPLAAFAAKNDRVSLLPSLSHDAMLREIKNVDFLLIPSREEPMPTVAAEGMMLSVPSVISDVCGVARYLTDGESGIVFKSEDVDALATAITNAVEMKRNNLSTYRELGRSARAVYEKEFSYERFQERLLAFTTPSDTQPQRSAR